MEVAVQPYLTAGVAVVGATTIALAPIQVIPPDLQIRGDRAIAVIDDISMSALSDLIAAANAAWSGVRDGLDAGTQAAQAAIIRLGDALQGTLVDGLGAGNTAVQS